MCLRPHLAYIALLLMTVACNRRLSDAEAIQEIGRQFADAWRAADAVSVYRLLAAVDTAAITLGELQDSLDREAVGILPPTLRQVDSVTTASVGGDSALLRIDYLLPDFEHESVVEAWRGHMVDSAITRDSFQRVVIAAPQTHSADTIALVRENEQWKVWLGFSVMQQFHAIQREYLKIPLADIAKQYGDWQHSLPNVWATANRELVDHAQSYIDAVPIGDSLQFSLFVEILNGGVGLLRGSIYNPTGKTVTDVWFQVWDRFGGTTTGMEFDTIRPGHTIDVFGVAGDLSRGRPERVLVLSLDVANDAH